MKFTSPFRCFAAGAAFSIVAFAFHAVAPASAKAQAAGDKMPSALDLSGILNDCTPSYFTNEGEKEAKWFLFRGWGLGWDDFQNLLADWRAKGDFAGMAVEK